jgi:2-C-methyl-D-erythritol 4-phosphate cytidylyltransferase
MMYQVVVPAAGQGKRMQAGKNKQFIELDSKPVIIHTLMVFEQDKACTGVILVINENERTIFEELIVKYSIHKVSSIVSGGLERQHSVYNGLLAIAGVEIVLVHDGARPFVKQQLLSKLVSKAYESGAAIAAVPVKDTIKKATSVNKVVETVERSSLWAVQTPQAFRVSVLKQAHEKAIEDEFLGTDEASLVERMDHEVIIVESDYQNIKLTTPEDLIFAEAILQKWTGQ